MLNIKFSLILCTVGDYSHIKSLFNSLVNQTYKNFEVILVDQNDDERLKFLLNEYKYSLDINHIKSEKGLSLARNIGMSHALGDVFSFPDDDCTYPKDLLYKVNSFMISHEYDGIVIRAENSVKGGRVLHGKDPSQKINKYNCLSLVHSISLFLSRELIIKTGDFDINLGLGAKTIFQGQEDRDYPIRALEHGFGMFYNRDITVLHPWDDPDIDQAKNLIERAYKGGASEVYLLNKHDFSFHFKGLRIVRKLAAICYFALVKMNFYKMHSSISGLKGMLKYFNVKPL